jgi:hypothetical protein
MAETNVVRLAAVRPIITHRQLQDLDFEPIAEFTDFFKRPDKRAEHEEKLEAFGVASRMAIGILTKSKAELIELIGKSDGDFPPELLETLAAHSDLAEGLSRLIRSAEIRFAAALANLFEDDDGDGVATEGADQ